MQEIWKFYKEIKHGPKRTQGIYEGSDLGRVKLNGKLYKCRIHNGYYYLCHRPLHRIVAELFLHDWNPNLEVDHINTITTDNRTSNLCMSTHKQNQNNPLTKQHNSQSHIGQQPWNKGKKGLQTGWNKGQHLTEEHKRKISENHVDVSGINNPFYNKTHTKEAKNKISEAKKGTHRVYRTDGTFFMEKN